MKLYRQGDIALVKLNELPYNAKRTQAGRLVLARGESTGHTHEIERGALYETKEGNQYLLLEEETELTHQEHSTHVIPSGIYEILRQREYTPQAPRTINDQSNW